MAVHATRHLRANDGGAHGRVWQLHHNGGRGDQVQMLCDQHQWLVVRVYAEALPYGRCLQQQAMPHPHAMTVI
jgi:hypothetical protein